MRRTRLLATMTLLALMFTVVAFNNPVRATASVESVESGWYHLRNRSTGFCLDDSSIGLRAINCLNNGYQSFWLQKLNSSGSLWSVRNYMTNACVDDSFQFHLRATACNGLPFQQFSVGIYSSGGYLFMWFQNNATYGCIDHSYAFGLRSYGCNKSVYQDWALER